MEPACGTAMLQPGEEASLVESEAPRDMVQSNDTSILQSCNLRNSAEMLNMDEEARSTGQESLSYSATLQSKEATDVKEEPAGNTAMMQQTEDGTRTIQQVPPSNAECVQPHEEPIVENGKFVCEHNNQYSEYACLAGENKST